MVRIRRCKGSYRSAETAEQRETEPSIIRVRFLNKNPLTSSQRQQPLALRLISHHRSDVKGYRVPDAEVRVGLEQGREDAESIQQSVPPELRIQVFIKENHVVSRQLSRGTQDHRKD